MKIKLSPLVLIICSLLALTNLSCIPTNLPGDEKEKSDLEFEINDEVEGERRPSPGRVEEPARPMQDRPMMDQVIRVPSSPRFQEAQPILNNRCLTCHSGGGRLGWGIDNNATEADWLERTPQGLVNFGDVNNSRLVTFMVHYTNDRGVRGNMPLGATTGTFPKSEYDAIYSWVENKPIVTTNPCGNTLHNQTETRLRYRERIVPFGDTCSPQLQTRTCNNGTFSAYTGNYRFDSCRVEQPRSCGNTGHGGSISRERFQQALVPFGGRCVSEIQMSVCENGTFGNYSGSFTQTSCRVASPSSCGNTSHGATQTRIRYQSASVPFGQTCAQESQTRTCNNGNLSAYTGSYQFDSCRVEGALSCNGTPHGSDQTRVRYLTASVPFGQTCQRETQRRTCNNGQFNSYSGSYRQRSCQVEPAASCGSVAHGDDQTRTRYRTSSVPFGETCVSETQERTCNNGSFGSYSGSFRFSSCQVEVAASCGNTPHGGMDSRMRYLTSSVPFGQTCQVETQTRTCNNGTFANFSGSYTHASCSPQAPANCGSLAHGETQTRVRYLSESVPFGQTCQSENQMRSCNNGSLGSYSGSFNYRSCMVEPEQDRTPAQENPLFAQAKVVLNNQCLRCHSGGGRLDWGVDQNSSEGDWLSRTPVGLVQKGDVHNSRLVTYMVHYVNDRGMRGNMPLGATVQTFSENDYYAIFNWVDDGQSSSNDAPTDVVVDDGNNNSTTPPDDSNSTTPPTVQPNGSHFNCNSRANLAPTGLRRLSRLEMTGTYKRLMWDIDGRPGRISHHVNNALKNLPPDEKIDGFKNLDNRLSSNQLISYFNVANEMGNYMTEGSNRCARGLQNWMGDDCICNSSRYFNANVDRSCFYRTINRLAPLIYRRPATQEDRDALFASFSSDRSTESSMGKVWRNLFAEMFQSPSFIFHTELDGVAVPNKANHYYLSPYELANKLTYFYWKAPPDAQVRDFISRGFLNHNATAAQYNQVVAYIANKTSEVDDEDFGDFKSSIKVFLDQYLGLDKVKSYGWMDNTRKAEYITSRGIIAPTSIENWPFREDQKQEVYDLFSHHIWDTQGNFSDVLTTNKYFTTNKSIASIYGVAPLTAGEVGRLNASQYAGLLSRLAFTFSGSSGTNPIHRGYRIREQVLCDELVAPEDVLSVDEQLLALRPPPYDHRQTTMERFDQKVGDASCMACHDKINPIGNIFEAYDLSGKFRVHERTIHRGQAYTVAFNQSEFTPQIVRGDRTTKTNSPVQFAAQVADSGLAHACFVKKLFRYSHARHENNNIDQCVMENAYQQLRSGNMKDAIDQIVMHPSFKMKRVR